ncbi:MAG: GNAT family N-acetyltransferase [Bacteroidota bacterium]
MTFREAKKEDLPFIVKMLADDELGMQREDFSIPLPEEYLLAFSEIGKDKNQELIVGEDDDGNIIATLQLSFLQYLTYKGGVRAQIEAVRIRKEFRSKGLGKEIFRWAIERAKERKAHLIQLTTDKKRPDALEFYKALGFQNSHEGMKLYLAL